MTTYRIALLPGAGIGREVVPAAMAGLDAVAVRSGFALTSEQFDSASPHYFDPGRIMPADAGDRLRPLGAIFFGAVGAPRLAGTVTLNGLLLRIRRAVDQCACVRPAVLHRGV